jgi:ABC-type polysaccharide/polyol phosphate transport system ATPase subunit
MNAALSFHDVVKHYRGPGEIGNLRDEIAKLGRRLRAQPPPPRSVIKAVDGVTFEIPEGEATALIGLNGAGKTTTLKLATRIAYPTRGTIQVRGRVGALIEVGSGMHQELTGRENVHLYGRILGIPGREIARRFDDIVDFAGIGGAIDQPVKQYSSGMQLRLGFAVASHLDPDIFVVDEAIAVGDAGFQYQCVERMSELVREGRTLILVSHQLSAIETLCSRAILLDRGRVVEDGPAREVVHGYTRRVEEQRLALDRREFGIGETLQITNVTLHDADGAEVEEIESGSPLTVRLFYRTKQPIPRPLISVGLVSGHRGAVAMASMMIDGEQPEVLSGEGYVECTFLELPLQAQTFEVWGEVRGEAGWGHLVDWQQLRVFKVTSEVTGKGPGAVTHTLTGAPVKLPYRWGFG